MKYFILVTTGIFLVAPARAEILTLELDQLKFECKDNTPQGYPKNGYTRTTVQIAGLDVKYTFNDFTTADGDKETMRGPAITQCKIADSFKAIIFKAKNEAKVQGKAESKIEFDTNTYQAKIISGDQRLSINPTVIPKGKTKCEFDVSEKIEPFTIENSCLKKPISVNTVKCVDELGIKFSTLVVCEKGTNATSCFDSSQRQEGDIKLRSESSKGAVR